MTAGAFPDVGEGDRFVEECAVCCELSLVVTAEDVTGDAEVTRVDPTIAVDVEQAVRSHRDLRLTGEQEGHASVVIGQKPLKMTISSL